MDFTFDEVQDDVRGLAARILGDHVTTERLKEIEAGRDGVDRKVWAELADAGLLGVPLPEDVGGGGLGVMELGVLLEEVGRRVAPVPVLATIGMAAMPIAEHGTDEQRKRWLVGVVEGASFLSAALQEPANADPLHPSTTARRDGSAWRLEGRKVAVPFGPLAERILVTAATGEGIGVFALDPSADGVAVEETRATHREPQANLVLDGAVVEEGDVLGDPSDGETARSVYRHAVAGICATSVGLLSEALKITASYVSEREQFGKPIATFQGATLKAADAYIDTEAVRVATWSAIWRLAEGLPADESLEIAKFWAAEGGHRATHICQHLHGGIGVDVDYPIHRYTLWAKELELALGGPTSHLLRVGAAMAETEGV